MKVWAFYRDCNKICPTWKYEDGLRKGENQLMGNPTGSENEGIHSGRNLEA